MNNSLAFLSSSYLLLMILLAELANKIEVNGTHMMQAMKVIVLGP